MSRYIAITQGLMPEAHIGIVLDETSGHLFTPVQQLCYPSRPFPVCRDGLDRREAELEAALETPNVCSTCRSLYERERLAGGADELGTPSLLDMLAGDAA